MLRFFKTSLLVFATLLISLTVLTAPVAAARPELCRQNSVTFLGLPTWYKYLNPTFVADPDGAGPKTSDCQLNTAFPGSIGLVLLAVVEILLRIAALAAVVFIIYGAFQYLISQGEPDKTKSARQTILNALIGLVIATLAIVIVNFVGARLS